jgi:hypothetical protein
MKASTMAATFSALSCRELGPWGASSANPAIPCVLKRFVHKSTVGREVPNWCAIAVWESPSLASRQIRERKTTLCGVFFARTHASNVPCCSSVIVSLSAGLLMHRVYHGLPAIVKILLRHYTRIAARSGIFWPKPAAGQKKEDLSIRK